MSVVDPPSEEDLGPRPVPASFVAFYEERHVSTVRQAVLMVKSEAAAEDIAHDAFLGLYHRWDQVSNHAAYLYRSVANGALRHLKQGARHTDDVIDLAAPVASVAPVEVAEALGHLPAQQRIAIVLKYYGDLTDADLADALGCRPGSVGPLLTRARAALREELGE